MAQLHINSLSAHERAKLVERRFSVDELAVLHAALARAHRARRRAFRRVTVFVAVLVAALLIMTGSLTGPTPALAFSAVALTILVAIVLTLTWVLAIGLYAHQFNDAVDEGYPELLGRYHL